MLSVTITLITFVCVAGSALIGLFLGAVLHPQHLSNDAKDAVKLGMGLIGTMTAILLGLLIASAKGFFDAQNTGVTDLSAKVILLDRMLVQYGSETKQTRNLLQVEVSSALDTMWSKKSIQKSQEASPEAGYIYQNIQRLSPQNDAQRTLQNQALSIAIDLAKTRWLMLQQSRSSVSLPLLVILVFWLSLIFCSFGLLAPRAPVVVVSLCLCALSVSFAIYLVMDLYDPYGGVVQVSSAPLRTALYYLGK